MALLDPQTMQELRDMMAQFGATPEERKNANNQALFALGFGLLQGRKGQELAGIGQAGAGALAYRNQMLSDIPRQKMDAFGGAAKVMQMQQALEQLKAKQAMQTNLAGVFNGAPNLPAMGAGGPTPANADAVAPKPIDQYRRAAALYAQQGDTEGAKRMMDMANSLEAEYSTTPQMFKDEQGNLRSALVGKRGELKTLPMTQAEKLTFTDTGGMAGVGVNPYTGKQESAGLPKSVDPNTMFSGNITMRGQNMADARSREANQVSLTNKTIEQIDTIRKQANALPDVQNYRAAVPMVNSAAKAPNTRAGDLDVIYAVGKALDPNSVVREGELNLVIKSGSLPQQIEGMTSYVMGGGKLPASQRQELMAMLGNRVSQLKVAHDAALAPYKEQAKVFGLPENQMFVNPPAVDNKQVVRRGTAPGGKRVVQYSDGSIKEE